MQTTEIETTDSTDCELITETIIARVIDEIMNSTTEVDFEVRYAYPDPRRLYETIAMLLTVRTIKIGYIQYRGTLDCIHSFRFIL